MPGVRGNRNVYWRRLLVVCGLSAAAFSAPVLDIYGRNPEVFVANRTSPFGIVAFGLVVVLIVPLLAALLLWVGSLVGGKATDFVYRSLVVILAIATGLVVSRQIFPNDNLLSLLLALAGAVVIVMVVHRFEETLAWFALAVPLTMALFITVPPSANLIWSEVEPSETAVDVRSPAPIVLIQLDEMPVASIMDETGGINEALFPGFARLAAEGTWYRNALSDSIATTQSVPAILTGRKGEKGMSPSSVDHPHNLFTLLDGAYEMHVIEWVADLCPEDVCPDFAGRAPARFSSLLADVGVVYGHLTMPPLVRDRIPSIDNAWKGFLGQSDQPSGASVEIPGLDVPPPGQRADWVDHIQRLTNGLGGSGLPTLSYAHLQAPHVPWETNPSGTHYVRPEEYTEVEGVEGDGRWGPDAEPPIMGFQRHLAQIGFLDRMLGRMWDKLEATGTWEQSMVVVVADHGASFLPGEHRRWPYENNRDDLYRVPLFIKYPGQTVGETRDEPVFGIDVLPTIVDALGISADWSFDGISLLDVEGTERPHEPIWWCCSTDGVSTELSVLFQQVKRNHEWVPDQSSWQGVAGVGPYAELVGESVTALDVSEDGRITWSLDDQSTLGDVEVGSGMVQTLLTGRIELPDNVDSDDLLIVVNNRVAGVGFVNRDTANGGAIRAFISEDQITGGPNEIDILALDDSGHGWLSGAAGVVTLDLFTDDGRRLEVQAEGSRRVQVDDVTPTPAGWVIGGWAADVTNKETPDTIYVFAGDALLAFGPPNEDNQNVVRWFGSEGLLRSGFTFDIDSAAVPDGLEQLTVVAEFGTYAVADPVRLVG